MTALNGEPKPSVNVETVGTSPSYCTEYQEDATTETNDQFRIRGLIPGVYLQILFYYFSFDFTFC